MSLELAAQHLASRGRKGDTMLVHMAPQEVRGLQALARAGGGTLTLNPDTGLPEANFLKRMLPTLIGAGLMFATGGTAAPLIAGMSNAATIGLGMGALETARTGSLEKGLMAGLGAYGGAGLTGGLMGAAAAKGAAGVSGAAGSGIGGAAGVAPANYSLLPQSQYALAAPPGVGEGLRLGASEGLKAGASGMTANAGSALANMTPAAIPAASTAATAATSAAPGMMKYGLAALSPGMQEGPQKPFDGGGPNPYEYDYDPNNQTYTRVAPGSRARDMLAPTTPMMAADGGMMSSGPLEALSDQNRMETMMANGGQMFARGGISHLGDYSDGGRLLKGPGDGVSDSIPATIANKRPARLADGEFVVPARIVSELGNGSTEAGARKLYAMMDRVQKARGKTTGKNRVAVNSRAEKLLPA